jgi:hypothetical protein
MRGPLFVGALQNRFVAARGADAGPQLIGNDGSGDAADILHRVAVALNEIGTPLRVSRLDVRVIRGAQHGDKQLDGLHNPGRRVDHLGLLAGVIDEQLLARFVDLSHRQALSVDPLPIVPAKR